MQSAGTVQTNPSAWDVWSWRSIELDLHTSFVRTGPAERPGQSRTFERTTHYIETVKGQRLLESSMKPEDDPQTLVQANYADGRRFANYLRRDQDGHPGQPQVTIQRSFSLEAKGETDRPPPLKYLYAGLQPVNEVLAKGTSLGADRHLDRPCERYLFSHIRSPKDSLQHVYWLDQATGVTLRHELFLKEQDRLENHPYSVWSALSFDEVAGRHIVRHSEMLDYNPRASDPAAVVRQYRYTVEKVVFDQDYPAELFWPKMTDQTKVFDLVANRIVTPKAATKPALVGQPIRAVEPKHWGPGASTAGLLLGLFAIVAGLFLWWRRS